MPQIVPASTPAQIEHVRSLLREYQSELPAEICFPTREWLNLPGDYAAPSGAILLATICGQPAGCVSLRPYPLDGVCEMKRLYVRPGFRGDGLGRVLVTELLNAARKLGYQRIRLDTHAPTMQAAIAMYRSFGFTEFVPEPALRVSVLSYMELPI